MRAQEYFIGGRSREPVHFGPKNAKQLAASPYRRPSGGCRHCSQAARHIRTGATENKTYHARRRVHPEKTYDIRSRGRRVLQLLAGLDVAQLRAPSTRPRTPRLPAPECFTTY